MWINKITMVMTTTMAKTKATACTTIMLPTKKRKPKEETGMCVEQMKRLISFFPFGVVRVS